MSGFPRFYACFAAAYGTIWLGCLAAMLLTMHSINTGLFGLVGFPFIALVYAAVRVSASESPAARIERLQYRVRQLKAELAQRDEEVLALME